MWHCGFSPLFCLNASEPTSSISQDGTGELMGAGLAPQGRSGHLPEEEPRSSRSMQLVSWFPHSSSEQVVGSWQAVRSERTVTTTTSKYFTGILEGTITVALTLEEPGKKRCEERAAMNRCWFLLLSIRNIKEQEVFPLSCTTDLPYS